MPIDLTFYFIVIVIFTLFIFFLFAYYLMWKDYRKNSRRNHLQTAGGKYSNLHKYILIIQFAISFAEYFSIVFNL